MRRRPLTQREDDVRMWVGIGAGAGVLAVLAALVTYGVANGAIA